jgi:hypothetical protein
VKKLTLIIVALAISQAGFAAKSFNWQNGNANAANPPYANLFQDAGFTTPIFGNNAGTDGGFLQLIYIGGDGYGGITPSGQGLVGDTLVGWGSMGQGILKNTKDDGAFNITDTTDGNTYGAGSQFIIRFFEQPGNVANGNIPTSGEYGYVSGFITTDDDVNYFVVQGNAAATLPLPEPSAILLGVLGVATAFAVRKVTKK